MRGGTSIVSTIAEHAEQRPEAPAIRFYDGDLRLVRELTYRALLEAAARSARQLSTRVRDGDAILLSLKFGPDYVVQLLGCMMAGAIPIPGMPATRRSLDRLLAMVRTGRPRYCLHDAEMGQFSANALREAGTPLLSQAALEGDGPGSWRLPRESDVALYQFTSGSTTTPKGVVISHANIIANQRAIARHFGHDVPLTLLGWLPLYHDMGLIGNVLQPLFLGGTAAMISPLDVVTRPSRWLRLIGQCGASTSGGPNFIYDMCVRHVGHEEMASLRLDGWTTAFNGSEMVRAHTLERFASKFECCGFRREALLPCYGLAEATLFVTAERHTRSAATHSQGFAEPPSDRGVFCGPVDQETVVVVVAEGTSTPVSEGTVGDVMISGPSVASAYLVSEGFDTAPFSSQVPEHEGRRFHRTGDQGFILGGRLVITGRTKDTIKLRGVTLHAEDIESLIERECADIDDHATCVVGLPTIGGEEAVSALVEVPGSMNPEARRLVFAAIKEAVSLHAGVAIRQVFFVPRNSLSRTSSGKFLRWQCKKKLLDGQLNVVETCP